MQLIIIVLAAFGLGFWFARSSASTRLADRARSLTGRLKRKSSSTEKAASQGEPSAIE